MNFEQMIKQYDDLIILYEWAKEEIAKGNYIKALRILRVCNSTESRFLSKV